MSEPSKSPTLSDRYWRLPWLVRIGMVIGVLIVCGFVYGAMNRSGALDVDRPARSGSAAGQASQAPTALPAGQVGEGTYLVGSDVQPGTYRSAGATTVMGFNFCSWRRLSDTSGESSAVIASGTGNAGEQQVVTIAATDRAFDVSGCEPFVKIG
ncbi:MAG: hypothetical protein L0I24_12560 [Pseudonocardia sp.]|nr:hypothetical protein [Pseudonocardia sp.]